MMIIFLISGLAFAVLTVLFKFTMYPDKEVQFITGFLLGISIFLIIFGGVAPDIDGMGQMICDEQYGEGETIFNNYYRETVICKEIEQTQEYDGGYTKLIKS